MREIKTLHALLVIIAGLSLINAYLQFQETRELTKRIQTLEGNFLIIEHAPFLDEVD